jgi:hypothetical protein
MSIVFDFRPQVRKSYDCKICMMCFELSSTTVGSYSFSSFIFSKNSHTFFSFELSLKSMTLFPFRGQCAYFSVKSQISKSYWVESSISEGQFLHSIRKIDLEFTANSQHCHLEHRNHSHLLLFFVYF